MVDYNAQTVDSSKWPEMTVTELIEQRNRMYDRYDFFAAQKKNVSVILQGIAKLEALIQQKNLI